MNKSQQLLERIGNSVPLNETATIITDSGYQLDIYSNDHNPPHIHVLYDNKEICKIEVMVSKPETIDDIIPYRSVITNKVKKDLLRLLNKNNEDSLPIWLVCKTAWRILHPNK